MAQGHPRCDIAANWVGFGLFHVSHCHSLKWLWVLSFVSLMLTYVALHHFMCFTCTLGANCIVLYVSLLLIWVALHHPSCSTATNCCGSVSFQVFHICSLVWVLFMVCVPLPFTVLALHHFSCLTAFYLVAFHCLKCPIASYCVIFVSFLVSIFYSFGWFWVVSSINQPTTHWGGFVLFHVSHCHLQEWLCFVLGVTLPAFLSGLCHHENPKHLLLGRCGNMQLLFEYIDIVPGVQ